MLSYNMLSYKSARSYLVGGLAEDVEEAYGA
jgi:hypothetical protein